MKNIDNKLSQLVQKINKLYGFSNTPGFEGPRINLGPCGVFADEFCKIWNTLFIKKAHICFIMKIKNNECWHIVTRLPDGRLFDGGIGIHLDEFYDTKIFTIDDMNTYDYDLLNERSFGLTRDFPRFCPKFDLNETKKIINETFTKNKSK